jgi:plastocyanin
LFAVAAIVSTITACGDEGSPPAAPLASSGFAVFQHNGEHERKVSMMDACDPTTFNAELGDGACVRNGGVTFAKFIEQLEKTGNVGSWRFSPGNVHVRVGEILTAVNRGGEVHTFTEVAAFGGGFVPDLNTLSGNPVPAPECLNFAALVFIPAGESASETVDEAGTELYQCCIHPWMRSVVTAR